jgi:2-oxoisovalerate dehydrogenase E1 component
MAERDPGKVSAEVDWCEVARLVLTSRDMDRIEEEELVPAKKVLYQFSARGHDLAQVLLGLQLRDGDGAFGYYRSRPLLLALGVAPADALGSGMGLAGGYSDGRDILARCLIFRGNRDSVAIVLDIDEQRQLLRCRNC